ncbi:MAG: lysoplasmalogenase [Myxococcales bacterium]|nr:lysoplasmalogenase [Myxococcales bacterium]
MSDFTRRRSHAVLWGLGLLGAAAFLGARWLELPYLGLAAKPVPILAMLVLVRARSPDGYSRRIALGLAASLLGDVLLELGPETFLPGVAAFLCAHLIYIAAFLRRSPAPRLLLALPFALWAGLAFIELEPGLGAMRIPVGVYTAAIAVMGWRASALVERDGGLEPWLTAGGALAFMASDTILAFNKFHAPVAGAGYSIILLYWIGQLGIAASAWNDLRLRDR